MNLGARRHDGLPPSLHNLWRHFSSGHGVQRLQLRARRHRLRPVTRGYTEGEYGRDIAYYIDGVPVNEISSIYTPNYADLNIPVPETVKSIEIVRGPFNVECGDSNLGGCVTITTKRSEPFTSLGLSGGSWGTGRAVATLLLRAIKTDDSIPRHILSFVETHTKQSVPAELIV